MSRLQLESEKAVIQVTSLQLVSRGGAVCAQVVVLLCLLGVVALTVVGLVKLEASVGRGCGWCQRVACVPTPWWVCESALGQQAPQQGAGAPLHAPTTADGPGPSFPGLLIR